MAEAVRATLGCVGVDGSKQPNSPEIAFYLRVGFRKVSLPQSPESPNFGARVEWHRLRGK